MKIYIAMGVFNETEFKSLSSVLDAAISNFNMDHWQYLYGFTNDKKLFNKFYKIHKNLSKKVIEMGKDEYRDFRRENKSSEISIYSFTYGVRNDNGKEVCLKTDLPCSKNEYVVSTDYCSEIYYDDIATLAVINPAIFKPKYAELLEYLDYLDCYIDYYGDETTREMYYYNSNSYYVSYVTGHSIPQNSISKQNKFNEVGFLMLLFNKVLDMENLHRYIMEGGD